MGIASTIAKSQRQRPVVSLQRLVLVAFGPIDLTEFEVSSGGFRIEPGRFEQILLGPFKIADKAPCPTVYQKEPCLVGPRRGLRSSDSLQGIFALADPATALYTAGFR